jgi:putative endonuclease
MARQPNLVMKNRETGALGEKLARQHLKRTGYSIIETNYRCCGGEIDIIAKKRGVLVFIEVKARTGTEFGVPEEAVTLTKKRKLIKLSEYYIQHEAPKTKDWRIDVVAIELDEKCRKRRVETIENAVTQDDVI